MDNIFERAEDDLDDLVQAFIAHLADRGSPLEWDESDDDQIEEQFGDFITNILPEIGEILAKGLKKRSRSMLADRRRIAAGFQKRQYKKWRKPFDLLLMTLEASSELAGDYRQHYAQQAVAEDDFAFEALVRLHARGCLIAREILHLMRGGFASGAMARWRALHETAVVAAFIRDNGSDTANRYLCHATIETRKAAHQQQQYYQRLGEDPHPQSILDDLDRECNDLCKTFGEGYDGDWGWAASALGNKRPTFAAIEMAANLDHFRPYFKLACYSTHAGSKALWYDLGTSLVPPDRPIILDGPSDAGMADPGQCTALSIVQLTSFLMAYDRATLTSLQCVKAVDLLGREAMDAFIEAGNALEVEARKRQANRGLPFLARLSQKFRLNRR